VAWEEKVVSENIARKSARSLIVANNTDIYIYIYIYPGIHREDMKIDLELREQCE
jgi:hypothetical protein